MEQKTLNIFVVILLVGIIGVSSLTVVQQMNYQNLDAEYQDVLSKYKTLGDLYDQIHEDFATVYGKYKSKVAEYDQLNGTYTSLLSTHDILLDVYGAMADELLDTASDLVALNTTYVNLMSEFEDLNITYYILTGEYDALNETYILLAQQYNDLNTTYWSLLDSYEILQLEIEALGMSYDQLQAEHNILQVEYDGLLVDFGILTTTYNTLLDDYTTLQSNHDALQSDYDNLWLNYNTLWAAHRALQDDYDALQANYVILQSQYNQLQTDYISLEQDYLNLQSEYDTLSMSYDALQLQYDAVYAALIQLQVDFNTLNTQYGALYVSYVQLQADYDNLQSALNTLTTWIRQMILPMQFGVFAEAVRRYYLPGYISVTNIYSGFARFCRDMVIHDLDKYDYGGVFLEVSNALSDTFRFGSGQLAVGAFAIMQASARTMGDPYLRTYSGYSGSESWYLNIINTAAIDLLSYEYDTDITTGQVDGMWDYPKFAVETAFRQKGDCEDQAIALAVSFESTSHWLGGSQTDSGETAIAVFHDPNHPVYGSFYHAVTLVHINDTAAYYTAYPGRTLWHLGSADPYEGYTWAFFDATWDTPTYQDPNWLAAYIVGGGISFSIMSIAICDVGGTVYPAPGIEVGAVGGIITSYQP